MTKIELHNLAAKVARAYQKKHGKAADEKLLADMRLLQAEILAKRKG